MSPTTLGRFQELSFLKRHSFILRPSITKSAIVSLPNNLKHLISIILLSLCFGSLQICLHLFTVSIIKTFVFMKAFLTSQTSNHKFLVGTFFCVYLICMDKNENMDCCSYCLCRTHGANNFRQTNYNWRTNQGLFKDNHGQVFQVFYLFATQLQ